MDLQKFEDYCQFHAHILSNFEVHYRVTVLTAREFNILEPVTVKQVIYRPCRMYYESVDTVAKKNQIIVLEYL